MKPSSLPIFLTYRFLKCSRRGKLLGHLCIFNTRTHNRVYYTKRIISHFYLWKKYKCLKALKLSSERGSVIVLKVPNHVNHSSNVLVFYISNLKDTRVQYTWNVIDIV